MIKDIRELLPSKDTQLEIIQLISKFYPDIEFQFTAEFGSNLYIVIFDNNNYHTQIQLENKKISISVPTDIYDTLDDIKLQRKIYFVFESLFKYIIKYCKDNEVAQGSLHKVYISTFYDSYLNILDNIDQTYIVGSINIFV